jgi:hypothetical protein
MAANLYPLRGVCRALAKNYKGLKSFLEKAFKISHLGVPKYGVARFLKSIFMPTFLLKNRKKHLGTTLACCNLITMRIILIVTLLQNKVIHRF